MTKFVLVKEYFGLDEIREYMEKNQKTNYYIAPKLMHQFLEDMRYKCVINLRMSDIKIREHNNIDLLTISVYNRVFEASAFKVKAVKSSYLKKVDHNMSFDYVLFGLKEDLRDFTCEVEEL